MDEVNKDHFRHIPYSSPELSEDKQLDISRNQFEIMNKRRSVRTFSNRTVSRELIDILIKTAGTAPSGANKQPWTFCVVSDADLKRKIRLAAEEEEKESYKNRMNEEWLNDLKHLGTNWEKPFLEIAPYLLVVFKQTYGLDEKGMKIQHYYVNESVGLACGFLLNAIHQAGLVSLTHTPSPMNFLSEILGRPRNEKPFLLIPVGYPAENTVVPDISRKALDEIAVYY